MELDFFGPSSVSQYEFPSFFQVHEYLRSKLCSLYENDCIFDKFECCWNGDDTAIMTGSYNNFFRMFDRNSRKEVTYEASRDIAKPKTVLKPRKVSDNNNTIPNHPDAPYIRHSCFRLAQAGNGRRTKSTSIVLTSTRRSSTQPGIPTRTSSQSRPPITFSCYKTSSDISTVEGKGYREESYIHSVLKP